MSKSAIKAPRGKNLHCKNWVIEAAYRMLQNNLDSEVAEKPDELIVYGGKGKAARDWDCFYAILKELQELNEDESLLIQSGKPIGVLKTHTDAPRVLIANSNLVPEWATWEHFDELDKKGLMMYGQMTAGSWIYIGTQGILQGTYETFAECGRKYFSASESEGKSLTGKSLVTAGLGGMGGAQPLAAKIAGASCVCVEIDESRIDRRLKEKYLDQKASTFEEALMLLKKYQESSTPQSIGVKGTAVDFLNFLKEKNYVPDVLTDQTSAHDPLLGYIPQKLSLEEAELLRNKSKDDYLKRSFKSMAEHVDLMLSFQKKGSIVFDYGNNLRAMAQKGGVERAFDIPGFVPEFIRPLFCEGSGPFRWVALSGSEEDIYKTDKALLELFPDDFHLKNWIENGAPQVAFQGLPSRICWLKYGAREKAALLFNKMVREGSLSAPVVIGRDHLDCGSVASPNRETEKMLDGSDAVSDWPLLNAFSNIANGASWVSFHHGGGVGMGFSQHAGMVIVADGSLEAEQRLRRVLRSDPQMGVLRHADAGYEKAIRCAQRHEIKIPMQSEKIK